MNNDGGPAFPGSVSADGDGGVNYGTAGMSLREWFAGQALVGMLSACDSPFAGFKTRDELAIECYRMADQMLVARTAYYTEAKS